MKIRYLFLSAAIAMLSATGSLAQNTNTNSNTISNSNSGGGNQGGGFGFGGSFQFSNGNVSMSQTMSDDGTICQFFAMPSIGLFQVLMGNNMTQSFGSSDPVDDPCM